MLLSPIHHTFAPLADSRYSWKAWRLSLMPWRYRRSSDVTQFEDALSRHFQADAITFGSGREGLFALLQSLKLQKDEEVIVQGYTCVVVPNAIHAAGMKTVYVDIDRETLNLNIEETEKAITPKTRVIICQHTFGIPANVKALRELCDRHSLILIEDCAHIIPDEKGPNDIGKYGDFLLFSFGRDKAISGIAGGAMISRHKDVTERLRQLQQKAADYSPIRVFALLQYGRVYAISRPIYGLFVGKLLLALASKCRMLIPIVTRGEKHGEMPTALHRMPSPCAILALDQFNNLQAMNDHRRTLTQFYIDEGLKRHWPLLQRITGNEQRVTSNVPLPLQKFPMFVRGSERIRRILKTKNIHLNDGWTGCVICPDSVDASEAGYSEGSDPTAESVCEQILSLPTHPTITIDQAQYLLDELDPLLHS